MDGVVVEDAAWLRKKEDNTHINVAELEAVVKGVNLALKWNIRRLQIMTDSTTVFGFLKCIIQNSKRVKTKGVAEMLVKLRLGVIKQLSVEYEWVPSRKYKAEILTRVRKTWTLTEVCGVSQASCNDDPILDLHNKTHLGVEKTFYMAKRLLPHVLKENVRDVVRNCDICKSIDPCLLYTSPSPRD